jgi:hypothetical protein
MRHIAFGISLLLLIIAFLLIFVSRTVKSDGECVTVPRSCIQAELSFVSAEVRDFVLVVTVLRMRVGLSRVRVKGTRVGMA